MKRPLLFLFLFFLFCPQAKPSDKFGTSFSSDYMTQSKQQDMKIQPVQTPAIAGTTPAVQQSPIAAPITTQQIQPPSMAVAQPAGISMQAPAAPIQTAPAMKKTRITVPDFEEKYKKMMAAQIEAKKKKKKSLIDSILEEIVHYGLLLTLLAVIGVVIYVLRKDKETPGTGFQLPQHTDKPKAPPKKSIWDDEF